MERIAFLIEKTGEQIFCLLNPENVVVRRSAGMTSRTGTTGVITGLSMTDDPLIATGGGITEVNLDLLFDTDIDSELKPKVIPSPDGLVEPLANTPVSLPDVRDLTRPVWNLAENGESSDGFSCPPLVRLIWGRAWNIPGVVVSVAEKFERFAADGRPQRSWLRLRLRRVDYDLGSAPPRLPVSSQFELPSLDGASGSSGRDMIVPLTLNEDGLPIPRIDEIVANYYGDASLTHAVLAFNGVADALCLTEGQVLVLPDPAKLLEQ